MSPAARARRNPSTGKPVELPPRMLPTDAVFWYAEEISPGLRSTIAGLFILEGMPDVDRFKADIERAVHKTPRFRQKVVDAPYHLLPPEWVEDEHMDFDYHVRIEGVPAPGTLSVLLDEAAALIATPLDRARPLWETHLFQGLEGGRAAVLFKAHHSMVDGVGAVALLDVFTDPTAKPRRGRITPVSATRSGGGGAPMATLLRDTVAGATSLARDSLSLAADAALRPGETLKRAMATARGAAGMLEDINADIITDPIAAAASGLSRRLDHCSVPMDALRHARRTLDATINDLVLTAVSGAVGRYHVHRGHHTEALRAMVPMSLRTDDQRGALGNRVGMLNIKLPIAESDPLRRLELLKQRTGVAKRDRRGALYPFLMRAMVLSPGFVFREFVKQMTTKVNLICTNIPGTPEQRYYSGQAVERIIPYAPIMERCPISVALLSYRDHLEVGIASDPEAIPDHDKFRSHLTDAFDEVLSLAGPTRPGPAKRRARKGPRS